MMELKMAMIQEGVLTELTKEVKNNYGSFSFSNERPKKKWIMGLIKNRVKSWDQSSINKLLDNITNAINNSYCIEHYGELEILTRKSFYNVDGKTFEIIHVDLQEMFKYAIVRKKDFSIFGQCNNFGDIALALVGTSPNQYYILENDNR